MSSAPMSSLAPVALFAYARPDHLQATLAALAANELAGQTVLTIFSDGPRSGQDAAGVQGVRALVRQEQQAGRFAAVHVVERDRNWGLADSIVDGVTMLCEQHGRVIVLEDDIVTSCHFLQYMNDALGRYAETPEVMHVSAHNFDIDTTDLPDSFFMRHIACWGWGTWQRAWVHFSRDADAFVHVFTPRDIHAFNMDGAYDYWGQLLANQAGTLKTWAVFWYASVFQRQGLCLHPRESLVENIGHDGSGANCGVAMHLQCKACSIRVDDFPHQLEFNTRAMQRVHQRVRELTAVPSAEPLPGTKNFCTTIRTIFTSTDEGIMTRVARKLRTMFRRLQSKHQESQHELLLRQFHENGCKPWTPGYDLYKWDAITNRIYADTPFAEVLGTHRFGFRIDERIVEYGWLFDRLPQGPGMMLDAGSTLNFRPVATHPAIASKRLIISTLAPEHDALWSLGISYLYEDLRHTCLRDSTFDYIVCISTIEHVGLDNTMLYASDSRLAENDTGSYLAFLTVMRGLLKPGGTLYLTLPYGLRKNHGWFQVFDAAQVDGMIERFSPSSCHETVFQYEDDRWQLSTRERAKDSTCFDIHHQKEYDPDFAAFSRGIVCLELKK